MAAETASRLAWADMGGPASHEQVTAAHLAHLSTDQLGVSGIFNSLDRIKRVLREDTNSLTHFPDPCTGAAGTFTAFSETGTVVRAGAGWETRLS